MEVYLGGWLLYSYLGLLVGLVKTGLNLLGGGGGVLVQGCLWLCSMGEMKFCRVPM